MIFILYKLYIQPLNPPITENFLHFYIFKRKKKIHTKYDLKSFFFVK